MLRVLVVDDEPMAIRRFVGLLEKTELTQVLAAHTDPEKALADPEVRQADLAFIDIEMPGMTGLILAEKLQQVNPTLDVVMVTAHDQYALEAFQSHAVGYLLKPVELSALVKQIRHLAEKRVPSASRKQEERFFVRSFGGFQCHTEENSRNYFKWRTTKARELMAFLHYHQGKPVSRDTIVDQLWPEMELDRAVKNFHATGYYLRELLKKYHFDHVFQRLNGAYRLVMEEIDSDEMVFSQLNRKLEKGTETIDDLQSLATIYAGPYCGYEDYPWAESRRFTYETAYLETLERLQQHYIDSGDWMKVDEIMDRRLQEDPYDEDVHEKRMEIYWKQRDFARAQDHYQHVVRVFRDELDSSPPEGVMKIMKRFRKE